MSSDSRAAQRAGLLDAIRAEPDDDTHRLIYADWLEEYGDEPMRAEFIRVQCEYATLHPHYLAHEVDCLDCPKCIRAGVLSGILLTRFRIGRNEHPPWAKDCPSVIMQTKAFGPPIEWRWTRGFVSSISCPWAKWEQHGPDLIARHPIERVTLTEKRPRHSPALNSGQTEVWTWWRGVHDGSEYLPAGIHSLLKRGRGGATAGVDRYFVWLDYDTEQDALDDLSQACVSFASNKARLPAITL